MHSPLDRKNSFDTAFLPEKKIKTYFVNCIQETVIAILRAVKFAFKIKSFQQVILLRIRFKTAKVLHGAKLIIQW